MTLKKQLILVTSTIIAIPILCVCFIAVNSYVHSSKRFYGNDRLLLNMLRNEYNMSEEFKFMSPDIEGFLISDKGNVLFSTLPDEKAGSRVSKDKILDSILDRNGRFFYHFIPLILNGQRTMLITRVPRKKYLSKTSKNFYFPILTVIGVLVVLSMILISTLARNLFKSVNTLQQQLADIASGKLDKAITIPKNTNRNEIAEISSCLEKMRISLLESQNKKNKFIMGISHDLRTPIAIIKGYTEALSDGVIKSKEEKKKAMELIKAKISHLENMINTLINFVKLENSDIRKTLLPKSINQVLKNFAKDAEATTSVFNRRVSCNIDLPNEYLIPLDEQLVNRVFENLLSNALRYTTENDEIKICAYEENNSIIIKFCDTGIGIAESDLANIFDLFYRASNSRREEGMGIGLSVVKNIIETHGWRIDVQSEKGKGSCFTIFIPVSKDQLQKN